MRKTIIEIINKKLFGIKANEGEENKVIVVSEITDFEVALEVIEYQVCGGKVKVIKSTKDELALKILKTISSGLYEIGYYTLNIFFEGGYPEIEYLPLNNDKFKIKIVSKFSDVLQSLREYFKDTSVKISEKKGTRIIISGTEGSIVLRKLDGSEKLVVESGLSLALSLKLDSGINKSRLMFNEVFELWYDNN